MTTDYAQVTVNTVRQILQDRHGVIDEAILAQTKKPLVALLKGLDEKAGQDEVDAAFDDVKESPTNEDTLMTEESIEEPAEIWRPEPCSPEWEEYVVKQFESDELDADGNPRCVGCRRLVQLLIGPIVRCGIANNIGPSDINHGTATVVFQVEVLVTNADHVLVGTRIFYEDIADVNRDNTDAPYSKHPSATAATRAEGRIYRKMLGLTGITAEESSKRAEEEPEIDWSTDDVLAVTDNQISVINMMCQRIDINVLEFINSGEKTYVDIQCVPHKTAQRMIQALNKMQQNPEAKPITLSSYDKNWRNEE